MNIENTTVFGAGKIGSQIAFHAAFCGYRVVVFDIDLLAIDQAKERIRVLSAQFMQDVGAQEFEISKAMRNITYSVNISEAIAAADAVIEAIPSDARIKSSFYRQLAVAAPRRTIFIAAFSHQPSVELAEASGRPEQFLGITFVPDIWKTKKVKITLFKDTDVTAFYAVASFAEGLGLAVLPIDIAENGK